MRIYKNEVFFGSINVAIPVKDLAVKENLVFASKDHDIIVTDLHLNGLCGLNFWIILLKLRFRRETDFWCQGDNCRQRTHNFNRR
jgi:hypothetical protein